MGSWCFPTSPFLFPFSLFTFSFPFYFLSTDYSFPWDHGEMAALGFFRDLKKVYLVDSRYGFFIILLFFSFLFFFFHFQHWVTKRMDARGLGEEG